MMRRARRLAPAALLAGALLGASALSACGDGGEEGEATTTAATATTSQEESTEPEAAEPEREDREEDAPEGRASDRSPRPTSPQDVIAAVLTRSGSPEQACEQLVTERFVRIAYGGLEGCRAARAPGATARAVRVREVAESGDRATAVAVPQGGPYDGIEVEVELVADQGLEGAWLVDSLVADVPPGP